MACFVSTVFENKQIISFSVFSVRSVADSYIFFIMKLILKIAWRNIKRHKGKSFVIGAILFLGAFIMTLGNAVTSGMNRGLQENIANRFTGHILVISDKQETDNVLFTPMGKSVNVLPEYENIKKLLDEQKFIHQYLPAAKGFSMILTEEGDMDFSLLIGVEFEKYQKMFLNNVILVEGELLKNGQRGVLLSEDKREHLYDEQNIWIHPQKSGFDEKFLTEEAQKNKEKLILKDNIVFMGSGDENMALDIRSSVAGIVKYQFLNEFWQMFNIIDIESFRECFNYVTAQDKSVEISAEKTKILEFESEDLDSLFGEDVVKKPMDNNAKYKLDGADFKKKTEARPVEIDKGSYNLVFIKLKERFSIEESLKKLNELFKSKNAGVRAISWKSSIGQIGDMSSIIKGALFGFVMFIFFTAAIIIVNTLSMAAMERINEIGMMRAVGAQKSFISSMFYSETFFLSAFFGGLGIVSAAAVTLFLRFLEIEADNHMLQLLFGGEVFSPYLSFTDILICVLELVFVTIISAIYPAHVARKIAPLEAIARD